MKPHVLVVDDDSAYADCLATSLAHDGREAVVRALQLLPDVVLMDVHMPVMDGIEVAGRLLPSARIVLISSSTDAADRRVVGP